MTFFMIMYALINLGMTPTLAVGRISHTKKLDIQHVENTLLVLSD